MMEPEPTSTQIRHLQNQLESLLNEKKHRHAIKEGAKSWTWNGVKDRLRQKRRAFDHHIVQIFEHSPVPTPENLYEEFDHVWDEEVKKTKETLASKAAKNFPFISSAIINQGINAKRANDVWTSYCKRCIKIAKQRAETSSN